jgi:mannose-6-phosphate isomerase-like protein (cupin superfamily)
VEKKLVVTANEAVTGSMQKGGVTFRMYIDEKRCGAKNFSLLQNSLKAGAISSEHKHDVESCWYFLSGKGTIRISGESFRVAPHTAAFVPAEAMHQVQADPGEDLDYLMIYAPGGPEQEILKKAQSGKSDPYK